MRDRFGWLRPSTLLLKSLTRFHSRASMTNRDSVLGTGFRPAEN